MTKLLVPRHYLDSWYSNKCTLLYMVNFDVTSQISMTIESRKVWKKEHSKLEELCMEQTENQIHDFQSFTWDLWKNIFASPKITWYMIHEGVI